MEFVLSRRSILQNFGHLESGFDAVSVPIFPRNGMFIAGNSAPFAPQLQPAEDVERAGEAVRAEGIDILFGHCGDGVVAGLGCLPTGPAGVSDGKNQDALLGQSIFDSKRIAVVKLFAPGFSSRTEDSSHSILHSFLDRLTTSAFAPLRMK